MYVSYSMSLNMIKYKIKIGQIIEVVMNEFLK